MPVKIAIVGTGMVADLHRRAIETSTTSGAVLHAVVHHAPEKFDALSEKWGVRCLSFEDALADDEIDAVVLCSPSGLHAIQTVQAAMAGKHVLVEKPMALNLEDAQAMVDACERADVRLGVVFQRRAEPLFSRIHRAVVAGDLGALTLGMVSIPYLRSQAYYDSASWRGTWEMDGGGILMNQGIHLIDLLLWYMGDPVGIQGYTATLHRAIEVEDTAAATLQFENGAMAVVAATATTRPGFPHRLELFGTEGGIQVEGERIHRWDLAQPDAAVVKPVVHNQMAVAGAGADPSGIPITGHIGIMQDFVDAIHARRAPLVDGRQGMRSLRTILSIYEATGLRREA